MDNNNSCDPRLARAFFQEQTYKERFSPVEALDKGTIFPELYCPYMNKDHMYDRCDKEDWTYEEKSKRKAY